MFKIKLLHHFKDQLLQPITLLNWIFIIWIRSTQWLLYFVYICCLLLFCLSCMKRRLRSVLLGVFLCAACMDFKCRKAVCCIIVLMFRCFPSLCMTCLLRIPVVWHPVIFVMYIHHLLAKGQIKKSSQISQLATTGTFTDMSMNVHCPHKWIKDRKILEGREHKPSL